MLKHCTFVVVIVQDFLGKRYFKLILSNLQNTPNSLRDGLSNTTPVLDHP